MAYRRSTARSGQGSAGPEAVRIRLLGGFRVSVGSRAIEERQVDVITSNSSGTSNSDNQFDLIVHC